MTEKTNPFPAYPVVRLQDDPVEVTQNTIVTEAVQESRDRAGTYIDLWKQKAYNATQSVEPLVIRIQGDYGTGKTHLLLDAAARVEEELFPLFPDATIIRISCLDTDPVEWFRNSFGPKLRHPFLTRSVVRLYALAGQQVAEAAQLTYAAADKLRDDPNLIYRLIKDDWLNVTAVEERFQRLLAEVSPDASEEIRRAFSALVWEQTEDAAIRWLAGEEIVLAEAEKLRLSQRLSSEADASGVLIAVAAVQNYVSRPFGVIIDELEHLTRHDEAVGGKRNVTWLKRLVEGLAKYGALVYISGHDSAWGPYNDFFDRFSQYKPISLRRWTAEDVLRLVTARASHTPPENFGAEQAEAVATVTGGNIRRVIAMCRALFRETSGFDTPVTQEDVRRVAEQIGQSISVGEATARIREVAERAGLNIVSGGILETKEPAPKRIQFDLVGFQGDEPRLVVELRHAFDQRLMSDMAKRFVAQMGEIVGSYPEVAACLVIDGNVDDQVLEVLRSDQRLRILAFDLTQKDAPAVIARELAERLSSQEPISPEAARLKELQDRTQHIEGQIRVARRDDDQELIRQLQQERKGLESLVEMLRAELGASSRKLEEELSVIEERRKAELEALYSHLEQIGKQVSSQREAEIVSPQNEEVTARLQTTYSDLTKPLSVATKFRLIFGNLRVGLGIGSAILGITLFFLAGEIADLFFPQEYYPYRSEYYVTKYLLLATSVMLVSAGIYAVWRRFTQTEAYFDYTVRLLREVYLQSPNPMALVRTNNILRDSLEEQGPVFGKKSANDRLAKELPEFFSYLGKRAERENEQQVQVAT